MPDIPFIVTLVARGEDVTAEALARKDGNLEKKLDVGEESCRDERNHNFVAVDLAVEGLT
jgi:hypothetical protein